MSGSRFLTADYRAGDVLLFGMHTMHMSTRQDTDETRVTCDVRWQPEADPRDERWFGAEPVGHYAWGRSQDEKPMAEARREWGV